MLTESKYVDVECKVFTQLLDCACPDVVTLPVVTLPVVTLTKVSCGYPGCGYPD